MPSCCGRGHPLPWDRRTGGGEADEGRTPGLDVDRQPACAGLAVHVEGHALLGADASHLGDRLDRADVVVHVVDCDEDGLGCDGLLQFLEPKSALGIDPHPGAGPALFLEELDGVDDAGMFRGADNEVLSTAFIGVGDPLDGEVGRFRAVRGEEDLVRATRVDQSSHLFPGMLQSIANPESVFVEGGRVPEPFGEERLHGLEGFGQEWRGRLVIEIDVTHGVEDGLQSVVGELDAGRAIQGQKFRGGTGVREPRRIRTSPLRRRPAPAFAVSKPSPDASGCSPRAQP